MNKKVKTKKKKRKIKYKNVFKFLLFVVFIIILVKIILNLSYTNIYIKGNNILKDKDIIDIASLNDYPIIIKNPTFIIKKRLESNSDIISADVKRKGRKIYIDILENRPLFYNSNNKTVVMLDKEERKSDVITPYLINYVPNTIYDKFITNMGKIDMDVLNRMSDIEYTPNDVDKERFSVRMTDGNLVYLTLNNFTKINNYIAMLKQFQNKKGILHLDSGEYFEIKE